MVEKTNHNLVKEIRENLLMSKEELARKAELSSVTIDNIEKGMYIPRQSGDGFHGKAVMDSTAIRLMIPQQNG